VPTIKDIKIKDIKINGAGTLGECLNFGYSRLYVIETSGWIEV
jgi:hypothetical protein